MADCNLCKYDKVKEDYEHCPNCENGSEFVRITNADRIRSMTDEELADFLEEVENGDLDYPITFCDMCKTGGNALNLDCKGCLKHWLQKECEV